MSLQELYQELIIDHGTQPRNFGEIKPCSYTACGFNPLCGDKLKLFIDFDQNTNKINNIKFNGAGCAISMASASLLTEIVKKNNSDLPQIKSLFDNLIDNLVNNSEHKLPTKLQALAGVKNFPTRIKCATLAWHALEDILKQIKINE